MCQLPEQDAGQRLQTCHHACGLSLSAAEAYLGTKEPAELLSVRSSSASALAGAPCAHAGVRFAHAGASFAHDGAKPARGRAASHAVTGPVDAVRRNAGSVLVLAHTEQADAHAVPEPAQTVRRLAHSVLMVAHAVTLRAHAGMRNAQAAPVLGGTVRWLAHTAIAADHEAEVLGRTVRGHVGAVMPSARSQA